MGPETGMKREVHPDYEITHYASNSDQVLNKQHLGRFDLTNTLSVGSAAPSKLLKFLKFAPVFLASNLLFINKAYAAG